MSLSESQQNIDIGHIFAHVWCSCNKFFMCNFFMRLSLKSAYNVECINLLMKKQNTYESFSNITRTDAIGSQLLDTQ